MEPDGSKSLKAISSFRDRLVSSLSKASLLIALLLPVFVCIYALVKGYDVANAVSVMFLSEPDFTIDSNEVPDLAVTSVMWMGNLENMNLAEMSGYAKSQVHQDVYYAINDSGGEAELYMLSASGKDLGVWPINLPTPVDWEDMASYQVDGVSYLIIGDTGDNLRWRDDRQLHIIREPDYPVQNSQTRKTPLPVERTIRFRFSSGPRDCEGLAVDVGEDSIYLVSKRVVPAEIYRLPLTDKGYSSEYSETVLTAEKIALLDHVPQPEARDFLEDPNYGEYRSQPTALDMQDSVAVVVTYKHAYLFAKSGSDSWAQAFSHKPQRIRLPPAQGREAGTLSSDGRFLYVSGERVGGTNPVGIFRVAL